MTRAHVTQRASAAVRSDVIPGNAGALNAITAAQKPTEVITAK
ncbi:MAG: hypothetical protein ACI9C1_002130 [Candidatus Aldehydirespiratoraceae bacterium]|jgi:hypothetical protein